MRKTFSEPEYAGKKKQPHRDRYAHAVAAAGGSDCALLFRRGGQTWSVGHRASANAAYVCGATVLCC